MVKKQSTHTVTKTTNSVSNSPNKNSISKKSRSASKKNKTMSKSVSVPIASSVRLRSQKPSTSNVRNGIRVRHTEMIGPVSKPTTQVGYADTEDLLQIFRLRCNPGSAKTFTWLSTLATNYEFFKFHRLEFRYETRSPTTTPGSIIISPDYDGADGQVAVNEKFLFNNKGTVDDSVWKHLVCKLEPSAMNRLYKSHAMMSDTRFETTNQDQKTIDPAQVFVCIDTADSNPYKFGKLFVIYDVELTEPQSPTEAPNSGGFSNALMVTGSSMSTTPFASLNGLPQWKLDPGVITPGANLPELLYPTATIGRFIKDCQGTITNRATGTGFGSTGNFYVSPNPNTPAGSAGDTPLSLSSLGAVGDTFNMMKNVSVGALAGQYLKMSNPQFTTLTANLIDFGAQYAASII